MFLTEFLEAFDFRNEANRLLIYENKTTFPARSKRLCVPSVTVQWGPKSVLSVTKILFAAPSTTRFHMSLPDLRFSAMQRGNRPAEVSTAEGIK